MKIARFLRQCDFDPEAVRRFKVLHGSRTLAWQTFCFGPDDRSLARLHQRVAATKPHGRRLSHPVAVHGTVVRRGESGTGKPFVVLAHDITPVNGESGRKVEVMLRSDHPTLLEPLTPGRQVLAVGDRWKIFSRKAAEEVQLWIEEHWSVASWTWDEETGIAGDPECPPALSPDQRRAAGRRPAGAKKRPTVRRRTPAPTGRSGFARRPARRRTAAGQGPRPTAAPRTPIGPQEDNRPQQEPIQGTPAWPSGPTAPPGPPHDHQQGDRTADGSRTASAARAAPGKGGAAAAPPAPPMPAHPPRPTHTPGSPLPPPSVETPAGARAAKKTSLRGLLDRWRGKKR
ncbi:hypothetical protein [Streptomyces sp. TR02-1]|uniref:hypothetical protein n=1 Tax=Streptomyces sp. TR02-1 TaxID=3385977 RepID=UPI0039A28E37